MSMFDNSHVTDVGLTGSMGRSVGFFDMISQGFEQQYRVDSARALDEELQDRWRESLRALQGAGQNFEAPIDAMMYRGYAKFVREGTPVTTPTIEGAGYGARINTDVRAPHPEFVRMQQANEAIKKLNNPDIKTFEQILQEVSKMQRETEVETASMSERSGLGGWLGGLVGAIGGSFTARDPLNIVTAPVGAGRTVATRIASEMALAAGVTAATEYGDVMPNRALAGLPERNSLANVGYAALGAGVIRGGIEGVAAGVRATPAYQRRQALRELERVEFDARDTSLRAVLETLPQSPSARAAASALDDTIFIERNNPYGEGPAANERFIAELQEVQRAMNGEPMTAVARVMPPVPFEYIEKAADFQLVKEQRPFVYAKMEAAQARLTELTRQIETAAIPAELNLIEAVRLVDEDAAAQLEQLSVRVNDETLPEAERVAMDMQAQAIIQRVGIERINKAVDDIEIPRKYRARTLRASRRAAHREYRTVYRQVEAEANRLRETEARLVAQQQGEGANIFAQVSEGRPFLGPLLRYDNVEAFTGQIDRVSETLDENVAARFTRETVGEGDNAVEVEVWERDGGIDIGLREVVDPDFRVSTDEGDFTVAEIMRDLQDDTDLVEAVRSCAI